MKTVTEFGTYFDTGVLVKLYHREAGSEEAIRRATTEACLPLTFLCEIELRNALRVLHGRKSISKKQLRQSLAAFDDDTVAGRLSRVEPDPVEVRIVAEDLSRQFAAPTLCRALDLLHVSAACVINIGHFLTGDLRQARLAEKAGLNVDFLQPK